MVMIANFRAMWYFAVEKARYVMGKKDLIIHEIEQVPEPFLDEVLDFVRFIKTKISTDLHDITTASESSLNKDWLRPEEDEAWQNL
jgi:hypothetical protein